MTRLERFEKEKQITPRAELAEAATGDRFLILVEGSETEKRYLEDLCGKLNFSAYHVIIESPDVDPVKLVESAIALDKREKQLAQRDRAVAYNQVWVVCDREAKTDQRGERLCEACKLATDAGIHIAVSIPSFEFWLLLHFDCVKTSFADCAAVEEKLNKCHTDLGIADYNKSSLPLGAYVTAECVQRACKYAESVRDHHYSSDDTKPPRYWAKEFVSRPRGADGNPSTDVDQLVRQLNLATNARFRFVAYGNLPAKPFSRD